MLRTAQAVRLEQKLEDEILTTAVKKLAAHRGDKAKQAEDLRELREMVRRDKRAVEVLSSVLGSSSGVSFQIPTASALHTSQGVTVPISIG